MSKPKDWKNYDDFAAGVDANRLPPTPRLAGKKLALKFPGFGLQLDFKSQTEVGWSQGADRGTDIYDGVEVAPDTFFIDLAFKTRAREALTLIVNTTSLRALAIRCTIGEQAIAGQPQVTQTFDAGVVEGGQGKPGGMVPAPTRELIGLRLLHRYSPNHLYEHTYLNSQRYCWQCLVGEQRGHGDVDLATYYKFDDQQYIFTFREFLIPVASVYYFNMKDLRSTGKFLGLTGAGTILNTPAGAFIHKSSQTSYASGEEPV
ncbi:MAG: MoaF N-terminal domain-containing protein [Gammaproteobacteria bacterium]|nr:MoaF N-terminal domain-containing protein [Gammaproteobacteria bacterium]